MRSQHPEECGLNERCQTCDQLFATKDALQTHIRSHTGAYTKQFWLMNFIFFKQTHAFYHE